MPIQLTKKKIENLTKSEKQVTEGRCRFCNENATLVVTCKHPNSGATESFRLCEKHKDYKPKGDLP